MKFLISGEELKKVLKLVKKISTIHSSKDNSHAVSLLKGDPNEKTLTLEFSLNDSFVSHVFSEVEFVGPSCANFKRSVDLSVLANMKMTSKQLTLEILEDSRAFFKTGTLRGSLIVASADIEKAIEKSRPKSEAWTYPNSYRIDDFLEAMAAHSYGRHEELNINDRPVRVYADGDILNYTSQDKIAACLLRKKRDKSAGDTQFFPNQISPVLKSLEKKPDVFEFDQDESLWSIRHGATSIWCPKILSKPMRADVLSIVKTVSESEGHSILIDCESFQENLAALKPFYDSELKDKDNISLLGFCLKDEKTLELQVSNKGVEVSESVPVQYSGKLKAPLGDEFVLNFEYVTEFISSLVKNSGKSATLELKWWPYLGDTHPMKGRAVAFSAEGNSYIVSRVNMKMVKGVMV